MESRGAASWGAASWSAESRAALEAVAASVAVLLASAGAEPDGSVPTGADPLPDTNPTGADPLRNDTGPDRSDPSDTGPLLGADPLRDRADACLDGLAGVARAEASMAALKVLLATGYTAAAGALEPPAVSPQEHTAREMAMDPEGVSDCLCRRAVVAG